MKRPLSEFRYGSLGEAQKIVVTVELLRCNEGVLRCFTGPLKRGHPDGFFVQLSRMSCGDGKPVLELRMCDVARAKGEMPVVET
jgi:hypothetical protein